MNYLVIEIQTDSGTTSTLTYQYQDLALANQKYYSILSAASVSSVDVHAAMIVDERGFLVKNESFDHRGTELTLSV